ncbi:MAG: hypothetical protein OEV59_04455 [Deltaproteobacteria bacterium]|nr:hypothetical protein [Deltaproteobacteria bacterium]
MKLGLNQNIPYRGETFHIQTEDGGRNNPVITTHLFIGGAILASRKTTYEDILKSDKLDDVVKEIMTEQHKKLMKELINGAFDEHPAIAGKLKPKPAAAAPAAAAPAPAPAAAPPAQAKSSSIDDIIMDRLSLKGKDQK